MIGRVGTRLSAGIWLLLMLALYAYASGLDSVDIPSNGDEHVYLHIARKTLESGHWLPLQSDLLHTRNTKPPLLFWQAMLSGGSAWTLDALRWPSVVYTFATALLLAIVTHRLTQNVGKSLLAVLFFLGCYSVYRYGRPLLTDAPEFFWLSLVALPMALRPPAARCPGLATHLCWGLALGVACLYKSFVLMAPVLLLYAVSVSARRRELAWQRFSGAAFVGCLAAACFALWPLLDPDPSAIWREFVVGENAGKLASASYWHDMWLGSSSIPSLFLALLADAGVLAPLLLGLLWIGWRSRREWAASERTLWLWVLILFLFFSIPGQRSGRYLLPALPALAVLFALRFEAIPRVFSALSAFLVLLVSALFVALTAAVAMEPGSPLHPSVSFGVACAGAAGLAVLGLWRRDWRALGPIGGSLFIMLAMGLFLRTYDAPPGPFTPAARRALVGQTVYVPCNFVASEEAYRFMLPGAAIRSYDLDWHLTPAALAQHHYFIARLPLDAAIDCGGCRVIGDRILVQGRLKSNDWKDIRAGRVLRHLMVRDVVLESSVAPLNEPVEPSACTPEGQAAHRSAVSQ
jgi:4-amino-4-deoxy-L-arabinose transferase-like glycosyltransferase